MKKVALGCDPNAAELKKIIKEHLHDLGYQTEDYGSDDTVYANVAIRVAEAVGREPMQPSAPMPIRPSGRERATMPTSWLWDPR